MPATKVLAYTFDAVVDPRTSERRQRPRERVLYSCLQLENDNSGVVLDISESGLAMSAVRSLTDDPLQMRFQLSESNAWIEARGRIAWTSPSRQTAGVEFVGLDYQGRIRIRKWLASIDRLSAAPEENEPFEEIAPPVNPASATLEPRSAVSVPDLGATERVVENPGQDLVATGPGVLPVASETGEADTRVQDSRATSALSGAAENIGSETRAPLDVSYEGIPRRALGDPRVSERRQRPRQRVAFSFIHLGDDNGGIILDVSERGLAMQTVRSLTDGQAPHIRFLVPQPHAWVETRARIAWISAPRRTAGVEFIGLPDEARNRIKEWISFELQLNESGEGIALGRKAEPVKYDPATLEPESAIPFSEPETTGRVPENPNPPSISGDAVEVPPSVEKTLPYSWLRIDSPQQMDSSPTSGRFIGLTVGIVLFLAALFLLAYHLEKNAYRHQQMGAIPSAKAPEPSTETPAGPTKAPVDQTPASDRPGFMLQVGAMTHKENADALAEALQRKNFSAFVFPPGTSRFYRVLVGPYSDADSALRAKEELKREGFESIRTPWEGEGFESIRTLWEKLIEQAPQRSSVP